jgi:chromosome segregation ATPase
MGDNDGKVAVADRTSETVSEVAAPRAQDRPSTPGLLEGFSTRPEPQPLADAAIAEAEAELAKTEQERDELPEKIRSAVLAADGKSAIALKKRSAELADEVAAARIRVLRLQIDHAEAAREDLVQRLPSLRAMLDEEDAALKAAQEHRNLVSRTLQAIRSTAERYGDRNHRLTKRLAEVFAEQGL